VNEVHRDTVENRQTVTEEERGHGARRPWVTPHVVLSEVRQFTARHHSYREVTYHTAGASYGPS